MDLSGDFVREVARLATDAARPQEVQIGGKAYATGPVVDPRKPETLPAPLVLHTLSGLVRYVESRLAAADADAAADVDPDALAVHVVSPTSVQVVGRLRGEFRQRAVYAAALPCLPSHAFGEYRDAETFNVWLMASFARTPERDAVLRVTANIKEEQVRESKDDGLAQVVTARAGVARVAEIAVPNPVTLQPYRTFHEVAQPESLFVLRLKDGPQAALFEADGRAWMDEAVRSIHAYLREALPHVEILA